MTIKILNYFDDDNNDDDNDVDNDVDNDGNCDDEDYFQVMVAAETSCPLRDYIEADCKNLVGLVSRMKDRWEGFLRLS